jgi:hypothetical protein
MLTTVVIVVLVVVLIVAAILVVAAMRPAGFSVVRSTSVGAPPQRILPLIADFHRWAEWSPYEKLDPQMKKTYAGAPSGPGAVYEWNSKKAGAGRMEILAATPATLTIKLDFTKPMTAHNTTEFSAVPQGGTTLLTWTMSGRYGLPAKVMCLFIDMDTLVGKDFDVGLASIKAIAER